MELKLFQCDEHGGLDSPRKDYSRLARLVKKSWLYEGLAAREPTGR